jgi:hypothetical protein
LIGQSDTNDAALVFKQILGNNDESSTSSNGDCPAADVSMTSCSSQQLQSLLHRVGSNDSAEDYDDAEDLLLEAEKETAKAALATKTTANSAKTQEEEKKEDYTEEQAFEDEDEEDRKTNYLPSAILPVASFDSNGEATVSSAVSALSGAPSVDASISSKMGWF